MTRSTFKPDAKKIERLRLQKGWEVSVLARKALISKRTLTNIMNGEHVRLDTISRIAGAFKVECQELICGEGSPLENAQAITGRRVEVEIKLSFPFDDFDETKQLETFIHELARVLSARDPIVVNNVRAGSTIITAEMSEDDLIALVEAFGQSALDTFRVDGITIRLGHGVELNVLHGFAVMRCVDNHFDMLVSPVMAATARLPALNGIILDFAQVAHLHDDDITAVLRLRRDAMQAGTPIAIAGATDTVAQLFHATGVAGLVAVFGTVADAMNH